MLGIALGSLHLEFELIEYLVEAVSGMLQLSRAEMHSTLVESRYGLHAHCIGLSQTIRQIVKAHLGVRVHEGHTLRPEALKGLVSLPDHAVGLCQVLHHLIPGLGIGLQVADDVVARLDHVAVIVGHQVNITELQVHVLLKSEILLLSKAC